MDDIERYHQNCVCARIAIPVRITSPPVTTLDNLIPPKLKDKKYHAHQMQFKMNYDSMI